MKIADILTHILPNWSPFPYEVRLIDGISWTIYRVSTNLVEYRISFGMIAIILGAGLIRRPGLGQNGRGKRKERERIE